MMRGARGPLGAALVASPAARDGGCSALRPLARGLSGLSSEARPGLTTETVDLRSGPACGALRLRDVDSRVVVGGWVQAVRPANGDQTFVSLRDAVGAVQLVVPSAMLPSGAALRAEDVVLAHGAVAERPPGMRNAALGSGDVEVRVDAPLEVLNARGPGKLAIPVERFLTEDGARGSSKIKQRKVQQEAGLETRLQHRHLDLRGARMQRNLRVRAAAVLAARVRLSGEALRFVEVETPALFKSTPEGAREFLVPTRALPAGTCYALAQSPQQYKQLLMAGGMERYFQLAKCFRDESGTRERQPEFTQLDLEMSFAGAPHVMRVAEEALAAMWTAGAAAARAAAAACSRAPCEGKGEGEGDSAHGAWLERNVPRAMLLGEQRFSGQRPAPLEVISFNQALEQFGSDKPDRRFGMLLTAVPQAVLDRRGEDENAAVVARALVVRDTEAGARFSKSGKGLQALADEFATARVCVACVSVVAREPSESSNGNDDDSDNDNDRGEGRRWGKIVLPRGATAAQKQTLVGLSSSDRLALLRALDAAGEAHTVRAGDTVVVALAALAAAPHNNNNDNDNVNGGDDEVIPHGLQRGAWAEMARRDVCEALGRVRLHVGKPDVGQLDLLWVTDFPLFEATRDEDSGDGDDLPYKLQAVHHPFTMPHADDVATVERFQREGMKVTDELPISEAILKVRGQHYDLVCNGMELGGGSVRVHSAKLQRHVFQGVLGLSAAKTEAFFGHLLDALDSGCPPHAGIALGVDRLINVMCATKSLSDVIAFPKSLSGREPLTGAPSVVPDAALAEYHLDKQQASAERSA